MGATTGTRNNTAAHTAEVITSLSHGPVEKNQQAENDSSETHIPPPFAHILDPNSLIPPQLNSPPFDLLSKVIFRLSPSFRSSAQEKLFSRIITPYDPDAFASMLHKHNFEDQYPFLVRNLRQGFPMGEFPTLSESVIFPNHSSVSDHSAAIQEYFDEEVKAG